MIGYIPIPMPICTGGGGGAPLPPFVAVCMGVSLGFVALGMIVLMSSMLLESYNMEVKEQYILFPFLFSVLFLIIGFFSLLF